jgi:enoyl-CoA hydratase
MGSLVTYTLEGSVATITMDDGKKNALSSAMLAELNAALDRALSDRATVLLTGREGVFSAGFDLTTLMAGGVNALQMVRGGFELAARVLAFPTPVVAACAGHAIAMGAFLMLSADYRFGVPGPFKVVANEVALGLTIPYAAAEICRQRLVPAHFTRTVLLSEVYDPEGAVQAGFFDRLVAPADLTVASQTLAAELTKLNAKAHAASKLRARAQVLAALKEAIAADDADLRKVWGIA